MQTGLEGGGEPRGQPEPLDFSPDGWPGHPRGPPLIDLGGKTENLALLWAPVSTKCSVQDLLGCSSPPSLCLLHPHLRLSAPTRGKASRGCAGK